MSSDQPPSPYMSRRGFTRLGLITAGVAAAGLKGLTSAGPAGAVTDHAAAVTGQAGLDRIPTMTFRHGAGVNTSAEIQTIKARIQSRHEPQYSNYQKLVTGGLTSLSYAPRPVPHVSEGIAGAAAVGANELITDSTAAYALALTWKVTGDDAYADKVVEILNAWSSTLVDFNGGNWMLVAAWSASVHPLAAEIIRDYSGWAAADKQRYRDMLNNILMPVLNKRYAFGNREFTVCNALVAIGVFNEDRAAFYQGVYHLLSYLPCYIYLTTDGSRPLVADWWVTEPTDDQYYAMHADIFPDPADSWVYKSNAHPPGYGDDQTAMLNSYNKNDPTPLWYGMSATNGGWINGACSETLRDLGHVELALAQIFATAEFARVQGIDLYADNATRLATFTELAASLRLGDPCPGGYTVNTSSPLSPVYEFGYDHLVNRLHLSLPNAEAVIQRGVRRAQSYYWLKPGPAGIASTGIFAQGYAGYSCGLETLTHGNLNGPSPAPWNLAFGRPAAASSAQDASHAAGNATDGDTTTAWASQAGDPQWISVDLGRPHDIDAVTLTWNSAHAKAYAIQVSADGTAWTTIRSISNAHGGVERLTKLSGTGRYVRLYGTRQATADGYSLAEFQVYGRQHDTPNLAQYRPCTASSTLDGTTPAANLTNGDITTRWASAPGGTPWVYVDLGTTRRVTGVILEPTSSGFPTDYTLQVSGDAATWTDIYRTSTGTAASQILFGLSAAGRYVRVSAAAVSPAGGPLSLQDLQVYGR